MFRKPSLIDDTESELSLWVARESCVDLVAVVAVVIVVLLLLVVACLLLSGFSCPWLSLRCTRDVAEALTGEVAGD